ncbi:MAG TPA: 1-acyl-sn-glycerol-3-phosphate acyltransferase [Anaeromyxobacteraceae bacterium]|nr:1-acyl-sn-glycerol-3-phosphate acyltransferase [Anaeromyxobacteraceae bacterium]
MADNEPQKPPAPRDPRRRRLLFDRWFDPIHLPEGLEEQMSALAARGSVVFVARSSGLINYLYVNWLVRRLGLPPLRVAVNFVGLFGWLSAVWRSTRALLEAASRGNSTAVVFLNSHEASSPPFEALVELQRKQERPIFLVPLILVWSRRAHRVVPPIWELVWGSPDSPVALTAAVAFLRNYKRAYLRVGRPLDLAAFVAERPGETDGLVARKARGTIHHHLARELRAAVGPPLRTPTRVEEKVMRDRHLREVLDHVARQKGRSAGSVSREARRDLREIASRYSPLFIDMIRPLFRWIFQTMYDRVEIDEKGLAEIRRLAAEKPLVLTPSHKSHVDYMLLSWAFYEHGLIPPQIAAGINLAFWPFGSIARRAGAFFIRRTFKGDKIYSATLRAYVKYLLRERFTQEFFPEGGRSRTGKLLFPKTGLLSMEVDAWADGAADDVLFVPIAVDYERLVEGASYAHELAGGEKKKESFGALLQTPRALLRRYGRIYLQFGTPVSLRELAAREPGAGTPSLTLDGDDRAADERRALVQHLANRIMWGIAEVVTVTPVSLVAAALLSHVRRGLSAEEVGERVELLRTIAVSEGARIASGLADAPSNPLAPGPIHDAIATFASSNVIEVQEAGGQVIYQVPDAKRTYLDFHRNAILNRYVGLSLVALSVRARGAGAALGDVREDVRFLSRLFRLEFMYPVGSTFEVVFQTRLDQLVGLGAVARDGERVGPGPARSRLDFLADLTRPYLEAYRIAVETVRTTGLAGGSADRKALVKQALERGRAGFLSGRVLMRESISKATLENAMEWLGSQGAFEGTEDGRRVVTSSWQDAASTHLVERIGPFLSA